jgi:hypothetical protein
MAADMGFDVTRDMRATNTTPTLRVAKDDGDLRDGCKGMIWGFQGALPA